MIDGRLAGRAAIGMQLEIPHVLLVENLNFYMRIDGTEQAHLAVLARDQILPHSRDFDVEIELRQVKIGSKGLVNGSIGMPLEGKTAWFIAPLEGMEIEQPGEHFLAWMAEGRR